MANKKIALIGNGNWGKKIAATLSNFSNIEVQITGRNWRKDIIEKKDGIIIATPPDSHVEIALEFVKQNIPVMIEKPLALSLREIEVLKPYEKFIFINYIHLFSEGYNDIKNIINSKLYDIDFISSKGCGTNLPRDYNALWDYGSHDISMILDISGKMPIKVRAFFPNPEENHDYFVVIMEFDSFKTTSYVASSYHEKTRCISVLTKQGLEIKYNDQNNTRSLPLFNVISHFITKMHLNDFDCNNLDLAIKVTKVLEACNESCKINFGDWVEII